MSDEEREFQDLINASGDDTIKSDEEAPWQIQDLHDLLSLQEVEEYSVPELQHILALNAALGNMNSFYQAYVKTFQDIHINSTARDRDSQTVPFTNEFYYSLPTPIEETVLHVLAKARELQSSNRFPNYDFERHTGNLAVVRNPAFFIEPITEANKQKLIDFNIARKARYDRYSVREEAFNNRSHIHFLNTITLLLCILLTLITHTIITMFICILYYTFIICILLYPHKGIFIFNTHTHTHSYSLSPIGGI